MVQENIQILQILNDALMESPAWRTLVDELPRELVCSENYLRQLLNGTKPEQLKLRQFIVILAKAREKGVDLSGVSEYFKGICEPINAPDIKFQQLIGKIMVLVGRVAEREIDLDGYVNAKDCAIALELSRDLHQVAGILREKTIQIMDKQMSLQLR